MTTDLVLSCSHQLAGAKDADMIDMHRIGMISQDDYYGPFQVVQPLPCWWVSAVA